MEERKTESAVSTYKTAFGRFLDRFFGISDRGGSIVRELVGGLITFLAMFYILNVNSGILSNWFGGYNAAGQVWLYGDVYIAAGDAYAGFFIATALSAGLTTILMGIIGKLPVGLASGMGLNSMVSAYLASSLGFNYAQMMMVVLVDGILFLIISLTPLRAWVVRAIPKDLKIAISAAIGFFICYLGFKTSGIITVSSNGVAMGNFANPSVLLTLIAVFCVFALSALPAHNKALTWVSRFAVIIVMVVFGIIEASLGQAGVAGVATQGFLLNSTGSWDAFGQIFGSVFHGFDVFAMPTAYPLIISFLFVDFFDTTGTLLAVEVGAGIVDENGNAKVSDRGAMVVDAVGTCFGAVCGTTTVTSFVESTSGVSAGARTGLASLCTGLLFILSIFIYPILGCFSGAIPNVALIYVGVCMFTNLKNLDWKNWVSIIVGFVVIAFMTFTASISDGIAFGFIAYAVCTLAAGKWSKKDLPVSILAVLFVALYVFEYLTNIK